MVKIARKKQLAIKILKKGGIGILPTDTIYGLVGSALDPKTVARIYKVRRRTPTKPLIILISKMADLKKFDIKPTNFQKDFLIKNWPGPISIILPLPKEKWAGLKYLHRGTKSLAFRLPSSKPLLEILSSTGPLVAPSANPEGQKPANTIKEAKTYFGDKIDFYLSGKVRNKASTLVAFKDNKVIVLREGAKKIHPKYLSGF